MASCLAQIGGSCSPMVSALLRTMDLVVAVPPEPEAPPVELSDDATWQSSGHFLLDGTASQLIILPPSNSQQQGKRRCRKPNHSWSFNYDLVQVDWNDPPSACWFCCPRKVWQRARSQSCQLSLQLTLGSHGKLPRGMVWQPEKSSGLNTVQHWEWQWLLLQMITVLVLLLKMVLRLVELNCMSSSFVCGGPSQVKLAVQR